jgi:hypothetical protein
VFQDHTILGIKRKRQEFSMDLGGDRAVVRVVQVLWKRWIFRLCVPNVIDSGPVIAARPGALSNLHDCSEAVLSFTPGSSLKMLHRLKGWP